MSESKEITIQPVSLNILSNGKFRPSRVGLEIADDVSYDEWGQAGNALQFLNGSIHWMIGDWLNYGERKWGEMYAQAIDDTGYEYDTLRADSYVADRIEFVRRRTNLPFSHHREVAPLDPAEQDELLDWAEAGDKTRAELRTEIKRRERQVELSEPEIGEPAYTVTPGQAWHFYR